MLMPRWNKVGFTLVELLIVVVVIAILATISAIAYRGMRERATTAAYSSAIDQWEKIFDVEIALTGSLPLTGDVSCLGKSSSDFPDQDGFSAGQCLDESGYAYMYDPDFFSGFESNNLIKGVLPLTTNSLYGASVRSRGIVAVTYPGMYLIMWYPQVVGQCGRGQSLRVLGGAAPGGLDGDFCMLTKSY